MKSRNKKILAAIVTISLITFIGLTVWTLESPKAMPIQTQGELNHSLLSYSKSITDSNVSDSSGVYSFRYGFDYPDNILAGSKSVFAVYAALTSEDITSPFTKGVSLQLEDGTLTIDGTVDTGIKIVTRMQPGVQSILLEFVNTNLSQGRHFMTTRLVVSTVDVGYIGFSVGTTQAVVLRGNFSVTT